MNTTITPVPTIWLHTGSEQLQKHLFGPIVNQPFFPKPSGGLWACPVNFENEHLTDWMRFIDYSQAFDMPTRGVLFTLKPNARVYTVDSQQDLITLIAKVGAAKQLRESFFSDSY